MCITFELPIRIVSELNNTDYWRKKYARKKIIQLQIWNVMRTLELPELNVPCEVTLTRIAPRSLDEDNLIGAMKSVRDSVASQLIPGLAPGRADSFKDITWKYSQTKAKPKYYALRVEISW